MRTIMIMSLGGSPEPLTRSIEAHKPDGIVFLSSHDSVALAGKVFEPLDFKPHREYEITEDPNILLQCYQSARRCVDRVKKKGVRPEGVTVDYTGGTKVMTAALILATIGEPYSFNYVGGKQRNKAGLGTVMDGHEKLFLEMSPWSIFAEEERRQVVTLFNRRRFAAVLEIIKSCSQDLPVRIEKYFRFVEPMAEGFLLWEQFNHKAALRRLDDGLVSLKDYLKAYADENLKVFSKEVQRCRDFLDRVITHTDRLKKLHPVLVEDLLNNARRRIMDQRYDDAAARIYRALEFYGQVFFQQVAGCPNSKVKPEIIPDELREEFVRKYRDPGKRLLKLPLTATFRYLKVVGHDAGTRYFERLNEIKNITSNRNDSILDHGVKPVSKHAVDSIFETVSDFVQVTEFFDFPALP